MKVVPPMCRMWPGDSMKQNPPHVPPTTCSAPIFASEQFRRVDAVLQRHYERVGAEQRPERVGGCRDLPGFHAEQHRIGRTGRRRRIRRLSGRDEHVAEHARDAQPRTAHRGKMLAARNEHDVDAGRSQARAEVAADAAGAEYRNAHGRLALT